MKFLIYVSIKLWVLENFYTEYPTQKYRDTKNSIIVNAIIFPFTLNIFLKYNYQLQMLRMFCNLLTQQSNIQICRKKSGGGMGKFSVNNKMTKPRKVIRRWTINEKSMKLLMYSSSKKKRNTPIYFIANYRREMKLVPIIMNYCLL